MPLELYAGDREGLTALAPSHSLPGALKMDEKAAVLTAEDQRYTGHSQALLCLAFLDDRLLFSSSADLSIKVRHSNCEKLLSCMSHVRALAKGTSITLLQLHFDCCTGTFGQDWSVLCRCGTCSRASACAR